MAYQSGRHPDLPIEVVRRRPLMRQIPARLLDRPERLEFHILLVCTQGEGEHWVDFESISVEPDTVLHLYPGQVHRHEREHDFEAELLLFQDSALQGAQRTPFAPDGAIHLWRLAKAEARGILRAIAELRREQTAFTGSGGDIDIMRTLLAVVRLRLARLDAVAGVHSGTPPLVQAFRGLVEREFAHRHTLAWYARELGCSERTLVRRCRAALGVSPKAFVDTRLALEAKRLLTNTSASVEVVGRSLGFDEPTHFSRFVKRATGRRPSWFRTT